MDNDKTEADTIASGDCQKLQKLLGDKLLEEVTLIRNQRTFVEQHLVGCPECAAFARFAEIMPALAPSVPTGESRRAAGTAIATYTKRRRRIRVMAISIPALAAAVATLIFVLYQSRPRETADDAAIALKLVHGSLNLDQPIIAPQTLTSPGRRITTGQDTARILAGEGVTLALGFDTTIKPSIATHDEIEIRLDSGVLAVGVVPSSKRRVHLHVVTPLGTVSVKGTVFAVKVTKADVQVDVVRGEVEIQPFGIDARGAISVAAGETFALPTLQKGVLDTRSRERILAMLGLAENKEPPVRIPTTVKSVSLDGGMPTAPHRKPQQKNPGLENTPPQNGVRRVELDSSPASETPVTPASPRPPIEELFRAARTCRADRNWSCAAAQYHKITELYPNRSEAFTALVPLAELQLRHLQQPGAALRNFIRYREQNPTGPLAEEAQYGVCRALKKLGRWQEEQKMLEEFLQSHPTSTRVSEVQVRLDELSD